MSISDGTVFTYWTTIGTPEKIGKHQFVICRCKCGTEKHVRVSKLQDGTSRSCGCWRDEMLTTHGQTKHSIRQQSHEYWIWNSMVQRTTNPNNVGFKNYGGRGIVVSDSWLKFENFFSDMGSRPSNRHSLERKDNNKGYSKDNCKWATRIEQNCNRRNTRFFTANGVTKHLAEWARGIGANHVTILARIKAGWSVELAVTTPPKNQGNKT